MYLTQLRLVNFRNYARIELMLTPGIQLFVGANAQGKSNLIEAVTVAATGRSYRSGHETDLIRWGESWVRVRAGVSRTDRIAEVDFGLKVGEGSEASRVWKELRLNGVPVRRGQLLGQLVVVVAAPEDGAVVTGRPAYRRRLLDLVLAQASPAYFFTAQRFARALLQRNQQLRTPGARAMEGWNEQVATLGAAITTRRRDLVQRLARYAAAIYWALSGENETLAVRYMPVLRGEDETEMIAWAVAELQRRRTEEVARGMTLVGPHRDEVSLLVNARELRLFGSRGQQHAALLALRLAARQVLRDLTGEDPVLLLDDALAALDERRQGYLLEYLRSGQTLVTVTTLATVRGPLKDAVVYRVAGGAVEGGRAYRA